MTSVRARVLRAVAVLAAAVAVTATAQVVPDAVRADAAAGDCPWVGQHASPHRRAAEVLDRMRLGEKAELVSLDFGDNGYQNSAGPIPRLCIPMLTLQDGPAGVAWGFRHVTQLPAPLSLAASFDRGLAKDYGDVQGAEALGKGIDVLQSPNLDVARVPQFGRLFETYGEDPYLVLQTGLADLAAIHAHHVMAAVKHFTAYNQETERYHVDAVVPARAMREIYMVPFRAAVSRGKADAVMCSMNFVDHVRGCAHSWLINRVLKNGWGFPGFVRGDYGAVHDIPAAFRAGLDAYKAHDTTTIVDAVRAGRLPMWRLDQAVVRILRQMFNAGLFDRQRQGGPTSTVTSAAHAAVAQRVAERGSVLLKNKGVLPLLHPPSIAMLGPNCDVPLTSGDGSSHVRPPHVVTPLEGVRARADALTSVSYGAATLNDAGIAQARTMASTSTVAIVCVGERQREGRDRRALALPKRQVELIRAVGAANPRTVVVVQSGGPVVMPWLSGVAAVVETWYAGQEGGTALARLLYGDVNFSGHLPVTFPRRGRDSPTARQIRWPGIDLRVRYDEGLAVGHRWYRSRDIDELFPFGYGLSYTRFSLHDMQVTPRENGVHVAVTVTNIGTRRGSVSPQVYVRLPRATDEPGLRLQGYGTASLAPGASRTMTFDLTNSAFTYWDRHWRRAADWCRIFVGTSARSLPLSYAFNPRTHRTRA